MVSGPNVRLEGESTGAGAVPVPVNAICCGLVGSESLMVTAAVRAPVTAGVKVTVMVQLESAGRLAPQLLLWPKLDPFGPPTEMLVIARAALAVFVTVT